MNRTGAFLILCALAALAACGQRTSPGTGLTPALVGSPLTFDTTTAGHAPCAIASPLRSPVKGTPPIVVAFGELLMNSAKTRYAFPGVEFAYHGGKYVLAATSGKATYLPNVTKLGQAIVVKTQSGVETLYAGFARPVKAFLKTPHRSVKAGQVIAIAGAQPFLFEYALSGNVLKAGTQTNPCGSGGTTASGTISVMPVNVAVYARFHTLSLDGTPQPPVVYPSGAYPAGSPDVATPSNLSVASVVVTHVAAPTVYEHSDAFSNYYVVLCGNVVFATGAARYRGPFTYPKPTSSPSLPLVAPSLPPLVFFRDAGELGKELVAPLPAPYGRACPAPAPANLYAFGSPVFNWVGQTKYVYYVVNQPSPPATPIPNDTVTFSSSSTSIVTIVPSSPSPLPVFQYAPMSAWPPPSPRADMTAAGVGTATITVFDSSCSCNDPSISVTVNPTPTPAEIPTPIPN